MLNQGRRIHTSVWFQFGVESNGSASDKATPQNTVKGETDGDTEREKEGAMLKNKPSPLSSSG